VRAQNRGVRTLFGQAFEYQQTVPFYSLFTATFTRLRRLQRNASVAALNSRSVCSASLVSVCRLAGSSQRR
jgi:hypothetical protein